MTPDKTKKFENVARKVLSNALIEDIELDNTSYGLINISNVVVTSDRSYLDIYVSCFKNSENLTKYMAEFAPILQRTLGKQIQTYKIPKVRFKYDESGELSQDLHNTINTLKY